MSSLITFRKTTVAGFTLIELLVVIAIIGVLSTIGLSTFSNAQMRARDARRRGDIKSMQDSFEQYYTNNNYLYATPCNTMATQLQGSALPVDPRNSAPYVYNCTATTTTYCACAQLEMVNTGNSTSNACAWGTGAGANFYCVRNLQ